MIKVKIDFSASKKWLKKVSDADLIKEQMKLQSELKEFALEKFNAVVKTWNAPIPRFDARITRAAKVTTLKVTTSDKRFPLVDQGVTPKVKYYYPKHGRFLRFRANYKAKTKVGVLRSFKGGASGPWVFARRVRAVGYPGRGFSWRITFLVIKEAEKRWNAIGRKWIQGKL